MVASDISNLAILFFKAMFKTFKNIYKFFKCVYQDYIFNRNYKRYLKYIDVYENIEDEENKNV